MRGIKPRSLTVWHGSPGAGKSTVLPGGTAGFVSDPRLSAISRDGDVIEINYHGYDLAKVPSLLLWMDRHGVWDYEYEGRWITFGSTTDADLFWLTFVGIPSGRFFNTKGPSFSDTAAEVKAARALAMQSGVPVMVDHQSPLREQQQSVD